MHSTTAKSFWNLFNMLPPEIRKQAIEAFEQFKQDPFHPGLNFELVNKNTNLWSARISEKYRVFGFRNGSEIEWIWIGTHDEYMKRIQRLKR